MTTKTLSSLPSPGQSNNYIIISRNGEAMLSEPMLPLFLTEDAQTGALNHTAREIYNAMISGRQIVLTLEADAEADVAFSGVFTIIGFSSLYCGEISFMESTYYYDPTAPDSYPVNANAGPLTPIDNGSGGTIQ